MNKCTYIIRSYEEELGSDIFTITVPEGTPIETVKANFDKAARYAQCGSTEDDEFTEEQQIERENMNGIGAFQTLLKDCGYEVGEFVIDYTFEW